MTAPGADAAPAADERRWPIVNERWEREPTPGHLMLALLDDPEVAATLRACRIEPKTVRARLRAGRHVPSIDGGRGTWLGRALGLGPAVPAGPSPASVEVERVVRRAMIYAESSDGRVVRGPDILVSCLAEEGSDVAGLLRELGLTRYDVIRYVAHGLAKDETDAGPAETGPDDGAYSVHVLNDAFTPMEFVVKTFEEIFQMPQEAAVRAMLDIHENGSAPIGTYDRATALAKVAEATHFGRSHQFALRCVVERAGQPRKGAHA